MEKNNVIQGDCLDILKNCEDEVFDLIYLDPPFLTQKRQTSSTRCGNKIFSFDDTWKSSNEYGQYIGERLQSSYRVLKKTGSIFVHCDRNSTHIIRLVLNDIFGAKYFQSEIIWYYKRWSNSKKGLLQSHQNILYYSKSSDFTFNPKYTDYSATTNIDQILQLRERNSNGKSIYKRDLNGKVVSKANKNGVPLCDVWEIPYLNPKAKERVGYPTQKPVLLIERILELSSNEGDFILDPFCGSGTTLVAASMMNRPFCGIDISSEAVELTRRRLKNPKKTESLLLKNGRDSYVRNDLEILKKCGEVEIVPVQRNKGIDAILKSGINNKPVPVRIQRHDETIAEALNALLAASGGKDTAVKILIKTNDSKALFRFNEIPDDVVILNSIEYQLEKQITSNRVKGSI